jgi:hypothetical protein
MITENRKYKGIKRITQLDDLTQCNGRFSSCASTHNLMFQMRRYDYFTALIFRLPTVLAFQFIKLIFNNASLLSIPFFMSLVLTACVPEAAVNKTAYRNIK